MAPPRTCESDSGASSAARAWAGTAMAMAAARALASSLVAMWLLLGRSGRTTGVAVGSEGAPLVRGHGRRGCGAGPGGVVPVGDAGSLRNLGVPGRDVIPSG